MTLPAMAQLTPSNADLAKIIDVVCLHETVFGRHSSVTNPQLQRLAKAYGLSVGEIVKQCRG